MTHFAKVSPDGLVLTVFEGATEDEVSAFGLVELPNWQGWPTPPTPHAKLHLGPQGAYWLDPRTLAEVKAAKNAELTAARVQADMRFQHAGKWFQADAAAWKQITGIHGWVAAQNSLPPSFPGQWKAEDNTYYPITTVAQWWAFYGSVLARGAQNFARSEQLKAQVAAATTVEEVEAITWSEQ